MRFHPSSKLKIDMLNTSNGSRIRRRRWNISRHLCGRCRFILVSCCSGKWTTIHFTCRVHSVCSFLTVTSLNSMIIKLLVCSPAFATLQLLFAGTQAHREGTAVSQSLSNSWSVWPNITTSRSRPSCGGDHFVLPGSATVDIRTPSVSDPSLLTRATGLWLSASRF